MAERRKPMQGAVENFFKAFDEIKRRYNNVELKLEYKGYWIMELLVDNKVIFNLKGNDTNILFDNGSSKLLNFLRK